jgi:hypothetical protein
MAQPLSEIQTAVVTAFRANAGVQAAMTGAVAPTWSIFDNVPVNQVFPYLYVGDMQGRIGTALSLGGSIGKASDVLLTLHIFSQYLGWGEVEKIVSAIDNVLNEKNLSLANNFTWFFCLFDNYIPLVEKDGLTRHGALRYRIMTTG